MEFRLNVSHREVSVGAQQQNKLTQSQDPAAHAKAERPTATAFEPTPASVAAPIPTPGLMWSFDDTFDPFQSAPSAPVNLFPAQPFAAAHSATPTTTAGGWTFSDPTPAASFDVFSTSTSTKRPTQAQNIMAEFAGISFEMAQKQHEEDQRVVAIREARLKAEQDEEDNSRRAAEEQAKTVDAWDAANELVNLGNIMTGRLLNR
jgi:hypothetical protein